MIVVVKTDGPSYLCKTDEVGEICVNSGATGSQYWGLQGLTNSTFKVQPLNAEGQPVSDDLYTRSGLLGFLGPGGKIYNEINYSTFVPHKSVSLKYKFSFRSCLCLWFSRWFNDCHR